MGRRENAGNVNAECSVSDHTKVPRQTVRNEAHIIILILMQVIIITRRIIIWNPITAGTIYKVDLY